jgi:hypothetical protein
MYPFGCRWRDVRGVGEAGKLSLPGLLPRLRGPSHLTTDAVGFEAGDRPYASLYPCAPSAVLSLPPSLCLDKKKRGKKRRGQKERRKHEEIPES